MKIICVGRNYVEHAKELNNEVPDEPVIFLKPDTAILKDNKPFYLPEWSEDIHHEIEVVYKIGRNGKYIEEKFAHKYISEVTVGIDFTARDIQNKLKSKGLPWELSKGFDSSAVIGSFLTLDELTDKDKIEFHLEKNGNVVQKSDTTLMIFPISKLISYISRYFTLKTGDLIFTGTPAGVGKVSPKDSLKGYIHNTELFNIEVR